MNWTMPYPWRSRRDSVRRINMSSDPGNESFFCALRPIPRILSLRLGDCASQVRDLNPARQPGLLTREAAGEAAVRKGWPLSTPISVVLVFTPCGVIRKNFSPRDGTGRDVAHLSFVGCALHGTHSDPRCHEPERVQSEPCDPPVGMSGRKEGQ